MQQLEKIEAAGSLALPTAENADRRRPGRLEHVSPALTDLLRGEPPETISQFWERGGEKSLTAAQGIMVATLAGLLMWAGLGWMVKGLLS